MKKFCYCIIVCLLSVCLLFSGCEESPMPNDTSVTQSSTTSTSVDVLEQPNYDSAISAYNQFLVGTIAAQDNQNQSLYITEMFDSFYQPGINQFTTYDINSDGTPELHTIGEVFTVFSFKDNRVIKLYESNSGFDTYLLLTSPGLMSIKKTTGSLYRYVTIGPDLSVETIEFFDAESNLPNAPYLFNNCSVEKKEFEHLTEKYFIALENPAPVQWRTYISK